MTDVALHACQSPWSEPGNFDGIRRTNVGVSRTAERPVAEYTRLRGSCGTRSYTPNGQPGAPTNDESAGPVFYGTPHAGFAVMPGAEIILLSLPE
jgi:hypothetical protein